MDIEQVRTHCLALPQATEDMPFGPDWVTYRVAGRIFALLPLASERPAVSLKCDPERAILLRDRYPEVVPGYHLNKRHWNTLYLDGTLPEVLIQVLLCHAWNAVVAKLPKRERTERGLTPLPEDAPTLPDDARRLLESTL